MPVKYATQEYVDRVEASLNVKASLLREDVRVISRTVSVLLEGQKRLETKVNGLETKVNGLETKVNGLETKVNGLETKVNEHDHRFDRVDANLRAIMEHLGVPEVMVPEQAKSDQDA